MMRTSQRCLGRLAVALIGAATAASTPAPVQEQATSAVDAVPSGDGSSLDGAAISGRPLSLEDALALGLSNNLGLERAEVDAEVARFEALSTWGAFDWVFDMNGQFSDSDSVGSSALFGGDVVSSQDTQVNLDLTRPLGTGGTFGFHFDSGLNVTNNSFANAPEQYLSNLSVSYVQPLMRGAGEEYATSNQREAEIVERRRLEERRQARQLLIHDVEVAYWELVAAGQQLEVAEAALKLGQEQIQREEARLRAGDGTEVDVLQAQTEVATRTETLLQTQNNLSQRGDDLKRLIVRDEASTLWSERIEVTTPLPEAAPDELSLPDWQDAFQVALGKRPDLRTSRLDVDTARIRLVRAQSERLYALDLRLDASSGSFNEDFTDALSETVEFAYPRYAARLDYNMPLQNRTASNSERAARERVRGSQITLEEAEVNALAEIRRALRDVRYRAQAVRASEQSFALAKRQLEAEQQRFEADLTTTFEVLQFQQTLIEAASNRSAARAEYAKSLVALDRARGTLGEETDMLRGEVPSDASAGR
ncbi:TolC family protein [Planctomycetota bacterium]|nr:TolC family protein [Planctomycetota bacterium]